MSAALQFVATLAAGLAIAAAMVRPALARGAGALLLALGAAGALAALFGGSELRSLELVRAFPAFSGNQIVSQDYPLGTTHARGDLYGLVAAGFCFAWAGVLRLRGGREFHPFWGPIALAWSSFAALVLLELAAAPAGLVRPLGFDRALLPASLAACVLLAQRCRHVFLSLCWLALFVSLSRLPLALFGTLATRERWGTSLDVHSVQRFADPLSQGSIEAAPGSEVQLGWLVWTPQLLVFPALYMISLGGISFAVSMFVLHPEDK